MEFRQFSSRQRRQGRRRAARQGGAIITVLFVVMILSILLIGVGTLAVSHQQRCYYDANWAAALDAAEAGVNNEYHKLSANPANADQSPGASVDFGNGRFTVYCTNPDGSTPWNPSGFLMVVSTGTINGVSRTIKASSKGFVVPGKFAIYTMDSISFWRGSALTITGDVGSNGKLDFTAYPTINGDVYFDGPDAGWAGGNPSGYTVVNEPAPVQWPTVDQIAQQTVAGGMATLAMANDNAKAIPPIVGNSITSSVALPPGNYYVTTIDLKGQSQITFNNANGPVNLWVGPDGGVGTCNFRGGTAAVPTSTDPTKACHIYVATQSGINMAGNQRIDALIYAYNKDSNGNAYGLAQNSGNPTIDGQIIANTVNINGNITVNYTADLIKPTSFGYYGYNNSWVELNPR